MDNTNSSTKHEKGQHLTYENRVEIQLRLKDGWTKTHIAKEIGCAYNTVKNEIARGTVSLYNGQVKRYKADAGQAAYEENRRNSRKQYKRLAVSKFIDFVVEIVDPMNRKVLRMSGEGASFFVSMVHQFFYVESYHS